MFLSLDIAASGLQAQQTSVDVVSNNLANVSTTAYKRQIPEFRDLLYVNLKRVGTTSSDTGTVNPVGIQLGLGVQTAAIHRDLAQGTPNSTSGPLDLTINGLGYFQVTMPDGSTSYTRDGTFQLSSTGEIVTADGYPVVPNITIPPNATSVSVNASGVVEATIPNQVDPSNLGQLQLATFINENGLQALGHNLYSETQASGAPVVGTPAVDGVGSIEQGFLETSNVNPVTEITTLITAQRAYEMNTKVITASDQMLQTLGQIG
ncbi:MAG TPA: flagellar basal-body rod protein FlgG [Rickettsiales bacterium]|nr:flagellar basal-body rod protein FlgG [Rickettsiales bacterium]